MNPLHDHAPIVERRSRLHRLDTLLDRLEWVNERGLDELPDTLVAALRAEGVDCEEDTSPTELIREVWRLQEPLLTPSDSPRRRRHGLDDDLDRIRPLPHPRLARPHSW